MLVPAPPPCRGYPGRSSWAILEVFHGLEIPRDPPRGTGKLCSNGRIDGSVSLETKEAWPEYSQPVGFVHTLLESSCNVCAHTDRTVKSCCRTNHANQFPSPLSVRRTSPETSSKSGTEEPRPGRSRTLSSVGSGESADATAVHYYWGVPFCPRGLDPDTYTQVVTLQITIIYNGLVYTFTAQTP